MESKKDAWPVFGASKEINWQVGPPIDPVTNRYRPLWSLITLVGEKFNHLEKQIAMP